MSGPSRRLLLILRLREWVGWVMVALEVHWLSAPWAVRTVLRGVARVRLVRRWLGIG